MSDPIGRPGRNGHSGSPTDRLAQDVADVVREEVRAVRGQLTEAARPAGLGIVLLAAAGLTAGYLATAVVLGGMGLEQLRAAGGSSARLADEVRDMVSATASRVVPAGTDAARDELGR